MLENLFSTKLNFMYPNRIHLFLTLSLLLLAATVFVALPDSSAVGQDPLTIKKQRPRPAQTRQTPRAKTAPQRTAPGKAANGNTASKSNGEKPEIAGPENVVLATSDGVKLTATYFKPTAPAEGEQAQAIPFILLHEWEGDRTQLLEYGAFLQSLGHAVIVPDLRGHGESTAVEGLKKPIDATKFRKNEIASVAKDIERCKKYLVKRNNEGEVNIDMLSVVAVGQTSVLAVAWVLDDWFAFPPYNAKGIKQGQDVKALVLVSPRKKLKGISLAANWKNSLYTGADGNGIPLMILWGSGDEAAKDSESLFKLVEKSRPDPRKIEDAEEREKAISLRGVPIRGNRSTGVQLMSKRRVKGLWEFTEKFVSKKLKANADLLPWKSREKEEKK